MFGAQSKFRGGRLAIASTVVATTITGIAIFDISALDAKPAAAAP
jgi:hypothetical protein